MSNLWGKAARLSQMSVHVYKKLLYLYHVIRLNKVWIMHKYQYSEAHASSFPVRYLSSFRTQLRQSFVSLGLLCSINLYGLILSNLQDGDKYCGIRP